MQPMFEVYEFSCSRCDGLVEIRPDRYADDGRLIYELKCAGCDMSLMMSAVYLDKKPTALNT